jgi:hypothetical protein
VVPADVWIDGAGRLSKLTATFDVAASAQIPGARMRLTLEFREFGAPVQITPPPATDVQDLSRLFASQ